MAAPPLPLQSLLLMDHLHPFLQLQIRPLHHHYRYHQCHHLPSLLRLPHDPAMFPTFPPHLRHVLHTSLHSLPPFPSLPHIHCRIQVPQHHPPLSRPSLHFHHLTLSLYSATLHIPDSFYQYHLHRRRLHHCHHLHPSPFMRQQLQLAMPKATTSAVTYWKMEEVLLLTKLLPNGITKLRLMRAMHGGRLL